ncbi:hypothetical protein [uncultured Muribaculum sp.]|uniref:hypothetical protein n=1 Tax=uncultured Muribaculum sp. TaxID=1918613 RepID=UPI0026301F33|nr:hypothetical protein [uncultured Muribaculum sp.]
MTATIILFHGVCFGASDGYEISLSLNGFRDGDMLLRYPVAYEDTASSGTGLIWDLSGYKSGKPYKSEITLADDSLELYQAIERRTALRYERTGDTIFVAGHENNLWRMEFDRREPWLTGSMRHGYSSAGTIHGKGIYCDRLRYVIGGSYRISVDAAGSLILPEGDTLRNVQRVHTLRTFLHDYYPIDSVDCDITADELGKAAAENRLLTLDARRWYAPGYRYPLLEVQTLTSGGDGKTLMRQASYTPASEMESLLSDPDNSELRERLRQGYTAGQKSNHADTADGRDNTGGGDDVRYRFDQNHVECTVSVRYSVGMPMDVEFILADVVGFVYRSGSYHCEPGEEYSVTLSYGNLPGNGPYVLYICTAENRYAEKFNR